MKKCKIVIAALLLVTAGINAAIVCTFNGEGADIIHEIAVKYKGSIRITVSGNELIKKVVYNRKHFRVVNNLHEVVVRPKREKLTGYITVITEQEYIYIFRLLVKTGKKEEKSDFFDQNIIIKR